MRNTASSPFLFLLSICIGLFACKKTTGNPDPPVDGNYQVVVNNGYGSGNYKPGDTVHIFSAAWAADQVFDKWSGDIGYLQHEDEWHEWFMMPAANVGLTAIAKSSATFTPVNTTIRGKNIIKQVYYYFPPNHKGIVYLLHGSGGHAANWINFFEYYSLIKDLVTDGFGFVITEAEEVSLNKDLDGDGAFRWALSPADTINNVDYANIRIITDSLINRGLTDRSKPRYSIGMSNGGAFSAALSMTYQFKAGVSYCAQSGGIIAQLTQRPLQFCMAKNDDNPNVGAAGNATAYNNYQTIKSRGICSQFFYNERSPLYPERFARSNAISLAVSKNIFNELKAKGFLDDHHYFNVYSDDFVADYSANPAAYPVISGLTGSQKLFVEEQISCAVADHHFYSDLNKTTLRFLNRQCN